MVATTEVLQLVSTGAILGIVHVLTGPDHLSALATLSANIGNFQAFLLGVRWGIGHSTGLLLVGIVLIALHHRQTDDDNTKVDVPDGWSHFFESLVGVFMLLLGAYGFRRAWYKRSNTTSSFSALPSSEEEQLPETSIQTEESYYQQETNTTPQIDIEQEETTPDTTHHHFAVDLDLVGDTNDDEVSTNICLHWLTLLSKRIPTRTMATVAGVIHGLAGPGGVLGVIPAVQLQDWRLAAIYLGCFCTSSTLTMGCYAALYGTCTSQLGRSTSLVREFHMECFSAGLSSLVGILWLTLLAMGKLEDVFP